MVAMYELCNFQNAINLTTVDGFCKYFDEDELRILEYSKI